MKTLKISDMTFEQVLQDRVKLCHVIKTILKMHGIPFKPLHGTGIKFEQYEYNGGLVQLFEGILKVVNPEKTLVRYASGTLYVVNGINTPRENVLMEEFVRINSRSKVESYCINRTSLVMKELNTHGWKNVVHEPGKVTARSKVGVFMRAFRHQRDEEEVWHVKLT